MEHPQRARIRIRDITPDIRYRNNMDAEKIIAEIKMLEDLLTLPDKRPLQMSDWKAANQKHDEKYASDPWFRLWKRNE